MRPVDALLSHDRVLELLQKLETGDPIAAEPSLDLAGGILRPSLDDPGQQNAILVARAGHGLETGRRWFRLYKDEFHKFGRSIKARRATVIFPGTVPDKPERESLSRFDVRLVSSVDWLWIDKLRVFDGDGGRDDAARRKFIGRFGANWTTEDEHRYTLAALSSVEDDGGDGAVALLNESKPDLTPGVVTVLYGPGGIGKSYFLRRTAHRMARAAQGDARLGVPIFAELPLLLTADALEVWLSHQGLNLPIEHISALIDHGFIVPVLDALDELVRGQAREGSKQFLAHLADLASPSGRVLLSSRDYFLNFDPLVRDGLPADRRVELEIGYFPREGRRRYVEIRAGLTPAVAARWAGRLEAEAGSALGESGAEVDALIGHPLFLEAFCQMLRELGTAEQANAIDTFRITSPDVFGQILEVILQREQTKAQAGWTVKFGERLVGTWSDPFNPQLQRKVLRAIVETVACDGSAEVYARETDCPALRDYRHAAFTFTRGIPMTDGGDSRLALREFLRGVLGEPAIAEGVPEDDRDGLVSEALGDVVATYLQHTVADTRPPVVPELVYALRNRAYFDYLLAESLLDELTRALSSADPGRHEELLLWCLERHIFERGSAGSDEPPNSGCLDFVLWHREAADHVLRLIDELFFGNGRPAGDVASYPTSLALAVMLRAALQREVRAGIEDRVFGVASGHELTVASDVVPQISGLDVRRCTFPAFRLKDLRLSNVSIIDSEFEALALEDSSMNDCRWLATSVERLEIAGNVHCTDCLLDIAVGDQAAVLDPAAELMLSGCQLSESLHDALEELARTRPDAIKRSGCTVIEPEVVVPATKGRQFVDKLVVLARKHGHDEYGLYGPKLRGLSVATSDTFSSALDVLVRHHVITVAGDMIYLTDGGENMRYSVRGQPGMRGYADVAGMWDPVVAELDTVL